MDVAAIAGRITEVSLTGAELKWVTPGDLGRELVVFEALHAPTGGRIEITADPETAEVSGAHAYMPDMDSPIICLGVSKLAECLAAYGEGKYRRVTR